LRDSRIRLREPGVDLGETRIEVVLGDEIADDRLAQDVREFLGLLLAKVRSFEPRGSRSCRTTRYHEPDA
jgi:hypothetical protein